MATVRAINGKQLLVCCYCSKMYTYIYIDIPLDLLLTQLLNYHITELSNCHYFCNSRLINGITIRTRVGNHWTVRLNLAAGWQPGDTQAQGLTLAICHCCGPVWDRCVHATPINLGFNTRKSSFSNTQKGLGSRT